MAGGTIEGLGISPEKKRLEGGASLGIQEEKDIMLKCQY